MKVGERSQKVLVFSAVTCLTISFSKEFQRKISHDEDEAKVAIITLAQRLMTITHQRQKLTGFP